MSAKDPVILGKQYTSGMTRGLYAVINSYHASQVPGDKIKLRLQSFSISIQSDGRLQQGNFEVLVPIRDEKCDILKSFMKNQFDGVIVNTVNSEGKSTIYECFVDKFVEHCNGITLYAYLHEEEVEDDDSYLDEISEY